ncbi:NACHT domain-containing protein [Streptomyces sp. NPDC050504]|uniref:NACHT domain-containing protein n=1 Tax=Streptomyces sp. NPDC050504 TaxID=3365618 RepID=UPI0037BABBA7
MTGAVDRTVVVIGDVQGSGVLISRTTVLTCAHVVGGNPSPVVAHPALSGRRAATVLWTDEALDVCALDLSEPLVTDSTGMRCGTITSDDPIPDCVVTGFPDIQRYGAEGHLALDQFTGTVLPAAGRPRRVLTFGFDQPSVAERTDGTSPLAGLSGSPVFAGDVLLGIVTSVPKGRDHVRVTGTPLSALDELRKISLEPIDSHHRLDVLYEREYARAVDGVYRRTKIFGLDDLSRREAEWDLDTAYLSLEAEPKSAGDAPVPQRIEPLLAGRSRVLLRGAAGAGKTTLVWWLAAHTSARTMGPSLAHLNDRVPFVVPLRSLRARQSDFPSPDALPLAAGLAVEAPPPGWAGRVLRSGRAYLLIDGLDEVTAEDREEAYTWLTRLLDQYPKSRCLVTVRPLAVETDWLKEQDFQELRLLPLRDSDIRAFVSAWHRAARLESDEPEALTELERGLIHQLKQNDTLTDLASTPLLCAVICALHTRRDGFLPSTRWDLYKSALDMLLGERDKRRKVGPTEGVTLGLKESYELLQVIAVWLVRGGQSEFDKQDALKQLALGLRGMVATKYAPEAVLNHLLNRSGLLQERAEDSFQFTHRTFQDFLAAKEFTTGGHLKELLQHGTDDQWEDVILLAAGHCTRQQLTELVEGLLSRAPRRSLRSNYSPVLAGLCSQHGARLDEATVERLRKSLTAMLPPQRHTVLSLARLGTYVLDLIPAPTGMSKEDVAAYTDLISEVGGIEAVEYAARFTGHPDARGPLARYWSYFPTEPYARQVLSRLDLRDTFLLVNEPEELAQLPRIPSAWRLTLSGAFTTAQLDAALAGRAWYGVHFTAEAVEDLSFLDASRGTLGTLGLRGSLSPECLAALPRFIALDSLTLTAGPETDYPPLTEIAAVPSLRQLTLRGAPLHRLSDVPPHPGVVRLFIHGESEMDLRGLHDWKAARHVALLLPDTLRELLVFDGGPPLSHVEWLEVRVDPSKSSCDLSTVVRLFPSLSWLGLSCPQGDLPVDLTPLQAVPDLEVDTYDLPKSRLRGHRAFGDRLTVRKVL